MAACRWSSAGLGNGSSPFHPLNSLPRHYTASSPHGWNAVMDLSTIFFSHYEQHSNSLMRNYVSLWKKTSLCIKMVIFTISTCLNVSIMNSQHKKGSITSCVVNFVVHLCILHDLCASWSALSLFVCLCHVKLWGKSLVWYKNETNKPSKSGWFDVNWWWW